MTTPTTDSTGTRASAAALLRAVADLIETRPDLPEPASRVSFYLPSREDTAATMAAIADALPCGWHAHLTRGSNRESLHLDSNNPADVLRGTRISITASASAVCVPTGAMTVTVWQPAPALTGLAGGLPLEEVA